MGFFLLFFSLCSFIFSVFFGAPQFFGKADVFSFSGENIFDSSESVSDGKFLDGVFSSSPVAFRLETARTPAMWRRGLMFRHALPENGGMIFVFPDESPHTFWMKNTLIPLDMIFLDSERRVVKVQSGALPCRERDDALCPRYPSEKPARYVIELAAGTAEALHLAEGDIFLIR